MDPALVEKFLTFLLNILYCLTIIAPIASKVQTGHYGFFAHHANHARKIVSKLTDTIVELDDELIKDDERMEKEASTPIMQGIPVYSAA